MKRPEFAYSLALFCGSAALVASSVTRQGSVFGDNHPGIALFFIAYGFFTIFAGYPHPRVGYVSFDRVSQVASILVLGPVTAAWVNGLASFIFPWFRVVRGGSLRRILPASLTNAGMMALMILGPGSLYAYLGGNIPLTSIDGRSLTLLVVMIATMQLLNEIGLAIHLQLRDGSRSLHLSGFALTLELGAGLTAVLVAIVFNRMEPAVVALLLAVLSIGMLVLTQFARMRIRLQAIVDERTRVLREKTVELEHLATRDQLTDLVNRRYAEEYLNRCIEDYHRYGRRFSIALIDLDHFKRINDHASHEAGDQVLVRIARILAARCRETDMVARYGGEEFLLCFPEADLTAVTAICDELRQSVAAADWSRIASGISVSLSAGVAEMAAGLDRSALLNAADRKLYEAKSGGRNLVRG